MNHQYMRGWDQRIHGGNDVVPPGDLAANGENKYQPIERNRAIRI
jgi:hypothetical protein